MNAIQTSANYIKDVVKQNYKTRDFKLTVIVSIVLLTSFSAYIFFIGAKKTEAKNLANQGVHLLEIERFEEAENKFEESLELNATSEVEKLLEQARNPQNGPHQ